MLQTAKPPRTSSMPWWGRYALSLVAVGIATLLIATVDALVQLANTSMLYLLAVLTVAVLYGSGPALFAAVVAFAGVDWFFVPPFHGFGIASRGEWVTLLLFLITAFITGQLAAGQRQRAYEAEQREREATILYDVVRLMSDPDLDRALRAVADRLRDDLDVAGVVVDLVGAEHERLARPIRAEAGDPIALDVARRGVVPTLTLVGPSLDGGGEGTPPLPLPYEGREALWAPRAAAVPPSPRRGGVGVGFPLVPNRRPSSPFTLHEVPVNAGERAVGTLVVVRPIGALPFRPADTRLLATVAVQLGLAVERSRLRREATEAEILRRGDDLKTSLLHAVSHDLRTPLATIMATAGSLRQEEAGWSVDERDELARTIEDEARRLNRIVENLLDLGRIQGGALQPELAWHDLRTVVDEVVARLQGMFPAHPLSIDVAESLPLVSLDRVFVDQILSNLVENAAKYTPTGSEIQISAVESAGEVWIEVADRGRGVAEEALDRLFEPFYRASRPGPRPGGLGIGLAVVRGLIEAQGGRVWARNRADGGLAITFTLWLAPEPAQSARNR